MVKVLNFPEENVSKLVPLHPKDESMGTKLCVFSRNIFLESEDIKTCALEEKVTLMKWGNALVKSLEPEITLELLMEDKDFKNTKKLNWIAATESVLEVETVEYDHILTRADAID